MYFHSVGLGVRYSPTPELEVQYLLCAARSLFCRRRFDLVIRRHGTSPGGKEGRRQAHKNIMPYRPIYLWEITVKKSFTVVTSSWDSSPWPVNGVAGPTGRQGEGPSGRSPAVGTYEGWVTSYGVCGHLLDSLSGWDHSGTLLKPEQARFGRFYVSMFFRKASPQTEGRRHAHLLIKT